MERAKLKVALVGCGQIADAHLQEIKKIKCASVVAVCDQHMDVAKQAATRFGVKSAFDNAGKMLGEIRPDVVHLTTPPHTHLALGLQCLRAGAHVYVEKPFAVDVNEADELLAAAEDEARLVCVGHDQLYDPAWMECTALVQRGELGQVVHVDSVQGYNLTGPFGEVFASNPSHWVHRLPGGFFQNVASHALYRITEFLTDRRPHLWAEWFSLPGNRVPFPTELRATLRGKTMSASLIFTSAARPVQRVTRIYGTLASVEVDLDAQTVRRSLSPKLPGALGKLDVPARQLRQAAGALARNARRFLRSDIQFFAGMNGLFNRFYQAILDGTPCPIPPSEVRRVTAIMEEIFRSCQAASGAELNRRNEAERHSAQIDAVTMEGLL